MKKLALASAACLMVLATTVQAQDNANQGLDPTISIFGIGGDNARTREKNFPSWIPQMAAIGLHTIRGLGGTGWGGEPVRQWDTLDWQLDYLTSQGFISGGGFYNYRHGAGLSGLPMDDLPGWSADVAQLVTHFKGKIKYWETWNEPPNGTKGNQTPADYAKFTVATYDAAKGANPDCLIGMAAKSVDVNYLDQAIKDGAKGHFDYITLHPYETLGIAVDHPGAEPIFMSIVPTVRKMLAAQDPDKINAPIWFTELGYDARHGANLPANALVKAYTMGIAEGVNCINWFEGMDGDSGAMGLIDAGGTPRPAYTAMAQMIKYLGQHPSYLGWVLLNDKDYGFVFQGAKDTILITWAEKGTTDNIDFGQPSSIVDPLTGNPSQASTYTLTEAPIIVDSPPNNLVMLAQGNKTKPFPWGGDYTDAKSVSVTFGETNVEKGLHTQSAASIAANVILYGGSARAGSVPGGNVFMVDPNFLSYTSTPIEITAVVRRNAANDPSQLELSYESTSGNDKRAPTNYPVPDNTDWHTATWRIDDAQFVSMYGYSFRFNSGSYVIQSVTVTKLDP